MPARVVASALGRSYGRTVALAPLDHEWGPGVHGVLGPNGAGKSTLLALLAGVLVPTTGRVVVGGAPLGSARRRAVHRRYVGLLPQEPGWPGEFTAAELLAYVALLDLLAGGDPTGRRGDTARDTA
ncbi:MAG TPA: ATP-binding cassette domain-containing protein [Cellulomonas sp.]